ncbi:MAG: PBP1A family penicillin-binding protein [Deltaproteobacteria bacterium]|nr:PBP1A family penicillin-binding protein [Deltaproteobacteria bacterium]
MVKENKKKTLSKKGRTRPTRRRSVLLTFVLVMCSLLLIFIAAGTFTLFFAYQYFSKDLPSLDSLEDYHPKTVTYFFSDDGRVIGEYSQERRIVVPLEKIPKHLLQAFIAAEDANFYSHPGIDLMSIARAFTKNILAGRIVQGGSTITQQVTRTFLLTRAKTYERKIREAILAYRIDKNLTKDEILYLYLNQIYLGHGAYGVEAAAQSYFNTHADQLTLAQAAFIAGLTQAPSRYSPFSHPERARERQLYTLNRMVNVGYITESEAERAKAEPLVFYDQPNVNLSVTAYFTEHVRRFLEKKYGTEKLYNDGLKVYTTANIEMQEAAWRAMNNGLRELTKRHEYRGPLKKLSQKEVDDFLIKQTSALVENPLIEGSEIEAVVTRVNNSKKSLKVKVGKFEGWVINNELKWALKGNRRLNKVFQKGCVILVKALKRNPKTGSWLFSLEQEPLEQSALICMDIDTGAVKAVVGGRDFTESQFNRAIQSHRQPGSAFKPIIYTAALDNGFTPSSIIIDSPIVYDDFLHMRRWKPRNYDTKFHGPTMLYTALIKSRNVITIKLLQKIGLPPVIETARKMGITSPLTPDLSLALGSSGVSLLELVTAYTVFPTLGNKVEPIFITRIEDRHGRVIEEFKPQVEPVINPQTAYVMLSMLEDVVKNGTARSVKSLNRPVAGKTGTTNDLADAWFIGFTPRYLTGVWVGRDELERMGDKETGGRAAAPIFLNYMKEILKDKPVQEFPVPEGVTYAYINPRTGALAGPETLDPILLYFKEGTVGTGITEVEVTHDAEMEVTGAEVSEKDL